MGRVNAHIRRTVKAVMKERGLTHASLAELMGMERPHVTRLLTGESGRIPERWQRLLEVLDLELDAVPKSEQDSKE